MSNHWDKLLASAPVDGKAARAVSQSHSLTPVGPKMSAVEFDAPPPFAKFIPDPNRENLVGRVVGRLTVVGYLGEGKWCCRCTCGKYVQRRNKVLVNPGVPREGTPLACCTACNYAAHLRWLGQTEQRDFRAAQFAVRGAVA